MDGKYLFVFGNAPTLGHLELETFLNNCRVSYQFKNESERYSEVVLRSDFSAEFVLNRLAGVVKIVKVLKEKLSDTNLFNSACEILILREKKVTFGVSALDHALDQQFLHDLKNTIKKKLTQEGKSVRFVNSANLEQLASVVISKQNVDELIIYKVGEYFNLGETVAVQNFTYWSKADYGRPWADPKSGMLPPKIARMMINIAQTSENREKTLLDPFCGMGTILQEGLFLNYRVVGSDISQDVLEKTRKNLTWYKSEFKINQDFSLLKADAAHLATYLAGKCADCIVTEGYLGPPLEVAGKNEYYTSGRTVKLSPEKIKNIYKGLEKMYLGCLKEWKKLLKPDALLALIFPSYHLPGLSLLPQKMIDKTINLGYSIQAGPLMYHRPGAIIRRNIYLLKNLT